MSRPAKEWAAEVISLAAPLLTGNERKARRVREAVLWNLCDRHNPKQDPFPKVATIAADVGCSERAAQRALWFWGNLGVMRVARRGRRTSLYRLHLGVLPLIVPMQSSPQRPGNRHLKPEQSSPRTKKKD
jgi:hypothetical protein